MLTTFFIRSDSVNKTQNANDYTFLVVNKYESIIQKIGGVFSNARPRSPMSEAQLAEYERDLGYSLPKDYREFLKDFAGVGVNAIYPLKDERHKEGTVFIFFGRWNKEDLESSTIEPIIIEETPSIRQVLSIEDGIEEIEYPREILPIAIDQGGNQVYLSLAGLHPGAVYLWMNWADIYFVADSFDEFMQSLEPLE